MPGLIQEPQFKHIKIKEIGETFVAEVEGVDFSQDIPQEVFDEILQAIIKVSDNCNRNMNSFLLLEKVWGLGFSGHRSG